MKTVIIGDIHGRSVWKDIVKKENPDQTIFVGDYFDSFEFSTAEQLYNFQEILRYKKESEELGKKVVLLIGNHDYHYFSGIKDTNTSGYQFGGAPAINQALEEAKSQLQMCYEIPGSKIIVSHAGISQVWLDNLRTEVVPGLISDFINLVWEYTPLAFGKCSIDPYGDHVTESPIWIRPKSLMRANKNSLLKENFIQVVGHTSVNKIDIKGKATGKKYYFIDALEVGEYLIYNPLDGITLGKLPDEKQA
jgi:predicted phosphodiesterase